jgi:hypothetical protein
MDPSSSSRLQDPWEHTKTIFDGLSSSSKSVKAQAILHAKQMALLVEEFDNLTERERMPSPREALIRCWQEVVAALSVDGKSGELLSANALQQALKKLKKDREEIETTIKGLRDLASPRVQPELIAPLGPGSAQQKEKEIAGDGADGSLLDLFESKLGKRVPEMIEEDESQLSPLRTNGVPCKIPKMPGKY